MQLRRSVPLSLLALLASAGCVCVGPQEPAPARGPGRPVGTPDAPPPGPASPPLPLGTRPLPLPLGTLPAPATGRGVQAAPGSAAGGDPGVRRTAPPRSSGAAERAPSRRSAKPGTPPRRVRSPKPATAHPPRHPGLPSRTDALCAAAEGAVPPSIVDLCLRQYGR